MSQEHDAPVEESSQEHNPFLDADHGADSEPTEQFHAGQPDTDQPDANHLDAEPTRQFDRVKHDSEPTEQFAADHHDSEPTEVFAPVTDAEPTQQLPPQQLPPQQFRPQSNDPEPTMALPAFQDQPSESSYTRSPVFSPTGFEQPAGVGAGPVGAAAFAAQQQESPMDRDARIMDEQAQAEAHARAVEHENSRRREAAEAARQRSLGTVTPVDGPGAERPLPPRRSTDKWFGAMGIFVLRLVLAAILAIRGYQMITDIPATRDLLGQIGMPYLEYLPWALAVVHGLAALGLVFGLGVRVIGVCVAALAGCALALVKWGTVEIFQSGMPGFVGELEVLIAAVGFLLLTLGSGGWGMDASWRHNRWRDKYGTE